jgi:hypothetical protein
MLDSDGVPRMVRHDGCGSVQVDGRPADHPQFCNQSADCRGDRSSHLQSTVFLIVRAPTPGEPLDDHRPDTVPATWATICRADVDLLDRVPPRPYPVSPNPAPGRPGAR